ncbi:hypothetical protein CHS0354_014926 [Potamilus streckersoni]|uniref:DUF19 domain-containing protein n=1 Tax=Potamilus streckersoni TaxID=2493646 RepID=A0AAE0S889_9BIVA|nr:hypothetical protein CHS0354_014926 [Potamilus streckersoni]
MDFKCILPILFMIIEFAVAQTDEVCDINKAKVSLQEYNTLIKKHNAGYTLESFRYLCLSQIMGINITLTFENSIKLCGMDPEFTSLQAEWQSLADQVRRLCQQKCPRIFELAKCEDMIVDENIKQQKFEEFCRTFSTSFSCALDIVENCEFQINMYYAILKPKTQGYWENICQSGCSNIDVTIGVIDRCSRPLRNIRKTDLQCSSHWALRDCVLLNAYVCPEVLKLVKYSYPGYDAKEKECFTTTAKPSTMTTTEMPTTVTITTTTHTATSDTSSSTTEIIIDFEDSRDQPNKESSYQAIIDMCIEESNVSEKELEDLSVARLVKHQILAIFRFESCLLKKSGNTLNTLIPDWLPSRYQNMIFKARHDGHDVIFNSLEEDDKRCTESSKMSGTPSSASKGYSKFYWFEMVLAVSLLAQLK